MTHLNALQLRLSNERLRLAAARSAKERVLRRVWVAQLEREVAGEIAFEARTEMTDDELLAALGA